VKVTGHSSENLRSNDERTEAIVGESQRKIASATYVGALDGMKAVKGLLFERTRGVVRRRVNHESGFACGDVLAVCKTVASCYIEVLKMCTGRC
jgi:hypothetical protein